jgi:endoglucanase
MQSLINIIRGSGATNVIQVPGVSYADMLSCSASQSPASCGFLDSAHGTRPADPANPSNPQLMADIDVYPDTSQYCNTTSCYDATYGPVVAQMPLEAGEVGPNGSVDTQANVFLNWMDAHGAGYYAWNWDTWGQLISSYTGTPKSPWGTDYLTRLRG